jgi:hypothetical protein
VARVGGDGLWVKFGENPWNWSSNLKTAEIMVYCFKILEKDKNQ